ncbi:MAG: hypothetical protein ABWX65_10035 [Mycetocola sp.]
MSAMSDPTQVRNQAALTTSTGFVWITLGSLLTVLCAGVLFLLESLDPVTARVGLGFVLVFFLALVILRWAVPAGRKRLVAMASMFGAIALVTLVCVLVISGNAWGSLGS